MSESVESRIGVAESAASFTAVEAPIDERTIPIPPLIRRNTAFLALAQAFVGTGTQLVPTLTAIMVEKLIHSPALFGLGTSLLGVSRLIVAYPIGYISDRYGRRVSLAIGQSLCLVGAMLMSLAMFQLSFPLFVLAAFVFGLGVGAGQQLRLAAADMFLPRRRGEGLGYVLTGSLVGAICAPFLTTLGGRLAESAAQDPLVIDWLLLPLVIVPGMILVWFVRPDPKHIAQHLGRFYPGYVPSANAVAMPTAGARPMGFREWVRFFPLKSAFVSNFAVQGVMSMMMAMTSLALAHHDYPLPLISVSVSIHVIGMFGLSIPLGRLVDRFGRRNMMLVGITISAFGSVLIPTSPDWAVITTGTFLVGLGWSSVNVASSALIADVIEPRMRGRVVGTGDTIGQGSSIVMPLAAGPLVALLGMPSLSVLALVVLATPVLLLLRLQESSPGKFEHAFER